jgi:hypothetical protein
MIMENITETNTVNQNFGVNPEALINLEATRKWTLFLSILGFVFIGLMLLMSVFFMSIFRGIGLPLELPTTLPMFSIIPMLIGMVIYFFPIFYLFQFSRFSKIAVSNRDEAALARALKFLKLHYQFIGILAIIGIAIYALAIIGALIGFSVMQAM